MPKLKTHKATAKRFRIKKSKSGTKVLKRANGQDHFNARQTGKTKRNKRSDKTMSDTVKKTILRAVPHA
jgi:ribosomal protein L35